MPTLAGHDEGSSKKLIALRDHMNQTKTGRWQEAGLNQVPPAQGLWCRAVRHCYVEEYRMGRWKGKRSGSWAGEMGRKAGLMW